MSEQLGTWDDQADVWTDPAGQHWGGPRIVSRDRRSTDETRWPGHCFWDATLYARSVDVDHWTGTYQAGRVRKFAAPYGRRRRPVWHLGDIGILTVGNGDDCTYAEAAEILDVTVARINQLIAEGDLTPIPERFLGHERVISLASVLAFDRDREERTNDYINRCMKELAEFLAAGDGIRDTGEIKTKFRASFSVKTLYATKKKMGIKTLPPLHPGGKGRWALPGTPLDPAEKVFPPEGPVYTTEDGKLRPTARQMMRMDQSITSAIVIRAIAKRPSVLRPGEPLLRSIPVPRPLGQTGRATVPGYYWEDWEAYKAGKEHRSKLGAGPGKLHAALYVEKVRQVKEELLKLIPPGSPSFRSSDPAGWGRRADEIKPVLVERFGVNGAVITKALLALGGKKKKEVVPWSEQRPAQRRVTWNYVLPDEAYARLRPAEERDLIWQRWSEEPGMSCGRIAQRHNRLNPDDPVSRETVKKALQRLRNRRK